MVYCSFVERQAHSASVQEELGMTQCMSYSVQMEDGGGRC